MFKTSHDSIGQPTFEESTKTRCFLRCRNKHRWVAPALMQVQRVRERFSRLGDRGWETTYGKELTIRKFARPLATVCPTCGEWFDKCDRTKGIHNPDKQCGARCLNAKGPNCECSCAGEHHGEGTMIRQ